MYIINNKYIDNLPLELVELIKEYIPINILLFLNKYYYYNNHNYITNIIKKKTNI